MGLGSRRRATTTTIGTSSRSPTVALPGAAAGGAGRIADQSGTGWTTLALRATLAAAGRDGAHIVDLGYQLDDYRAADARLEHRRLDRGRADDALLRVSRRHRAAERSTRRTPGRFADAWRATLGVRCERWQRVERRGWRMRPRRWRSPSAPRRTSRPRPRSRASSRADWSAEGVARPRRAQCRRSPSSTRVRSPTNVIVNNDPNLEPEKSWTSELTARARARTRDCCASRCFHEDTDDALYSQTNVTVMPNVTNIQNVDQIRTQRPRGRVPGERRCSASGLDLSTSLTYAHSRIEKNDEFPGERRQMAAARAGVARQRARDLSLRLAMVGHARRRATAARSTTRSTTPTRTASPSRARARSRVRSARRAMRASAGSASLGIDNIGDEEYWAFHPYTQRSVFVELGVGL